MNKPNSKMDIINRLRKEILQMEGYKVPVTGRKSELGLGMLESAFPNEVFPLSAIHEFLCTEPEHGATSGGFICGILNRLMLKGGTCLWISTSRTIFPPALYSFGVEPHRVIFIDLYREKEVLWVMEEALKCEGLAAVVAELKAISFSESRRLQLAVENSRVTGFIIRKDQQKISSTACAARWKVTSLPSSLEDGMPGLGFPRWNVELLKVKNGNPGSWKIEWSANKFTPIPEDILSTHVSETERKAG